MRRFEWSTRSERSRWPGWSGLGLCLAISCLGTGVKAQQKLSPPSALAMLKAGNKRFVTGKSLPKPLGDGIRRSLAKGQSPYAIVVACADSRVPPEHIFNAGLGDLFVIRVAGNVCDPETLASIEYAAVHLQTPLCVVMGHAHCGAIQATASGVQETRALSRLTERISPALQRARSEGLLGRPLLARAEKENVYQTVEEALGRSPDLEDLVKQKKLMIVPALYDLDTGEVEWLPDRQTQFEQPAKRASHELAPRGMPPHVALTLLQAGHRRFLSNAEVTGDISQQRRRQLVSGQVPAAVIVTCADSRVSPEHLFDAGLGELFVIRVAGNVLNDEVTASIEYAAAHTGASLCIVLGHQSCGAVTAALEHADQKDLSPSMRQLLARIEPSVERAHRIIERQGKRGSRSDILAEAIDQNVLRFTAQLRARSPLLSRLEEQGRFGLLPAVYMLETGDIRWLKDTRRSAGTQMPSTPTASATGSATEPATAPADHVTSADQGSRHSPAGSPDETPYPLPPAPGYESRALEETGHDSESPGEEESKTPHLRQGPMDNDDLLFTVMVAALVTIAGMMGLILLQKRS